MDGLQPLSRLETATHGTSVPRKALLVLGMSRSGTSLVTHVLHKLGAALPPDLVAASHGNPLGHWEPRALAAINGEILLGLDRQWDDPRSISERWFRSREAYGFLQRIMAEIIRGYSGSSLLLLKDPRICRLLPLYLEAFDVLDIEPLVILQVRPAAEVAQSLADRDGLDHGHSELLWLRSVIEAEWHSRSCRRVWVSFDQMIADWQNTVRRIGATLGVSWPVAFDAANCLIAPVLKPRLRHRNVTGCQSCAKAGRVLSTQVWQAVEHGLAADEPTAQTGFDTVRATLRDLDRMYCPFLARLQQQHDATVAAIHVSTSWRLTAPLRALGRWALRQGLMGRQHHPKRSYDA